MLKACVRIGLVVAFLVGGYASSQEAKPASGPSAPAKICNGQQKCDELGRLYVLDAYKSALIAQIAIQKAQEQMQETARHYSELTKWLVRKETQEPGTTYLIDVATGTVVATPPAEKPKQEKK